MNAHSAHGPIFLAARASAPLAVRGIARVSFQARLDGLRQQTVLVPRKTRQASKRRRAWIFFRDLRGKVCPQSRMTWETLKRPNLFLEGKTGRVFEITPRTSGRTAVHTCPAKPRPSIRGCGSSVLLSLRPAVKRKIAGSGVPSGCELLGASEEHIPTAQRCIGTAITPKRMSRRISRGGRPIHKIR